MSCKWQPGPHIQPSYGWSRGANLDSELFLRLLHAHGQAAESHSKFADETGAVIGNPEVVNGGFPKPPLLGTQNRGLAR